MRGCGQGKIREFFSDGFSLLRETREVITVEQGERRGVLAEDVKGEKRR